MKKYKLTENFRVDFTAHAPLHKFKGWCVKGISANIELDFNSQKLVFLQASADIKYFTTGDVERDHTMMKFMETDKLPKAFIELTQCNKFEKITQNHYEVSVLVVLEFMGIRRQLPILFFIKAEEDRFIIEVAFKWSFKAYGLKAPRLLFLTVRDIVDIKGRGEFIPVNE